ncbi:uncharacterized protein LOC115749195 isoform X2 [Rhodamnia argentea]|uniref:Uncharacterized protein LOC115749195 isoform X2 n=1 Tax=Rhodamnia argentea TaxID=178133 RepID=A0A8B8Q613_9MYRT|nr:uncharacterized protein LOC115749195 isoform X2 [Rhodamnia argentea]
MPGTIQISVLDIVNLPSQSPPSSMSIKVTMGKKEYQIGDDGDFSIPLTTLRENLVVRLLDKDGNEVSRTGVETKLAVEKGLWDDFFPFEGGGEVHLKIRFTLSDEEQNRIRMMRLSALKKKHGELLNPTSKVAGSASAARSKVATEGNLQISGSLGHPQVGFEKIKAEMAQGAAVPDSSEEADAKSGICKLTRPSQKQIIPVKDHTSHTDRSEDTSPSTPCRRIDTSPTGVSSKKIFKKIENQSSYNAVLAARLKEEKDSLFPHLTSTSSTVKTSLVFPGLEKGVTCNTEAQDPLERTPSNVRKVISVFESSLAQDMQPCIKAPPAETEPSTSRTEDFANHQFKKIKTDSKGAEPIPQKVHSPFLNEESQQAASRSETGAGPTRPLHVTKSSHDTGRSNITATENQPDSSHDWSSEQHESRGNVVGRSGKAIDSVDSQKIKFRRAPNDKVKSMSCCQRDHDAFERSGPSGAWIFPYEPSNLCITSGGKQATHLMGCCSIETSTLRGKIRMSMPENAGEGRRNENEAKKDQTNSYRKTRPKTDNSTDVDSSGGPIGQVMKVAIMVGFGALVLLTRQRKDR